jgi:hypothetical protein
MSIVSNIERLRSASLSPLDLVLIVDRHLSDRLPILGSVKNFLKPLEFVVTADPTVTAIALFPVVPRDDDVMIHFAIAFML